MEKTLLTLDVFASVAVDFILNIKAPVMNEEESFSEKLIAIR